MCSISKRPKIELNRVCSVSTFLNLVNSLYQTCQNTLPLERLLKLRLKLVLDFECEKGFFVGG